ncbi:MAG TPA: hypothetical protein VFQ80_07195 [Thermomicrobiales bacterium]|jgi:hypothetical protein|nr:hypothetical protein [Thermomicrobiales bacterium]
MSDPTADAAGDAVDDAAIATFLDEIECAAERLRRLPLADLTPEIPYQPEWPEPAS